MNLVISQGDFQAVCRGPGDATKLLLATNSEIWEERHQLKEVRISKKEQGLGNIEIS